MKISAMLSKKRPLFSFEFFPPKTPAGETKLMEAVGELKALKPDFVSVTYGALGSNQEQSLSVVEKIHRDIQLNVMAHYTCIGASRERVDTYLDSLTAVGIENILALRGDLLEGMDPENLAGDNYFKHAIDLVRYIRRKTNRFSIGVAGYPETHLEAPSVRKDIEFLKTKVDAGADFIITQLFFRNDYFYEFCDRAETAGIHVPIIPGIMPIENFQQIIKITSMSRTTIPAPLQDYFSRTDVSEHDKVRYGIEYTTTQCRDLLESGVCGVHFYTLNKSSATRHVMKHLKQ